MEKNQIISYAIATIIMLSVPAILFFLLWTWANQFPELSPGIRFLVILGYFTVLFAIAGGFETSLQPMPKDRRNVYLFFGAIFVAMVLMLLWFGIRNLLERVFDLPNTRFFNFKD